MLNKKILIADKAFVDSKNEFIHDLVTVFPMEKGDGAYRAELDHLVKRSIDQKKFYDSSLVKIVEIFNQYYSNRHVKNESAYIVLPILMTLTPMYLDRCLRVLHRLRELNDFQVEVLDVDPTSELYWINDIEQSWKFNQNIIKHIATALGLKATKKLENNQYPEYPESRGQKNLLFAPHHYGFKGALTKFINRFFLYWTQFQNKRSHFLSLGFGYDAYYLNKKGFFGPFGLFQKMTKINFKRTEKNIEIRHNIAKQLKSTLAYNFQELLKAVDPQSTQEEQRLLGESFCEFFADMFPIGFLEGIDHHFEETQNELSGLKLKIIIGHDCLTPQSYILRLWSKAHNVKFIGVQHGGHYGYIEDMSVFSLEYLQYDSMINWGWKTIDSHFPQCQLIPLASPKLSERILSSNYFANKNHLADILFYSNLFHRFPHITTCGQARVDFLDEIFHSQIALVTELNNENIKIHHKPFGMKYVDLYPEHFKNLENAGNKNYELIESTQKGLNIELIKQYKLMLWDQIGTGTLECLTSKVPTMIFWERMYSRESLEARIYIENLEKVGVLHCSAKSLANEVKKYLENPQKWMENSERVKAIDEFCFQYARISPNWSREWREALKNF